MIYRIAGAPLDESSYTRIDHSSRISWAVEDTHYLKNDYWDLLRGWASRVRLLQAVAGDEQLAVLRYEDLSSRFTEAARALFGWLDLPIDERELARIQLETEFEQLTERRRGEVAAHVMRKGSTGEWREILSKPDAEQAWLEIGSELSILGYTRFGEYEPLKIRSSLLSINNVIC